VSPVVRRFAADEKVFVPEMVDVFGMFSSKGPALILSSLFLFPSARCHWKNFGGKFVSIPLDATKKLSVFSLKYEIFSS